MSKYFNNSNVLVILLVGIFVFIYAKEEGSEDFKNESRTFFQIILSFFAGYIAGLVETLLLYPLDRIRTQQALLNRRLRASKLNFIGMFARIYQIHGISGYYQGISMFLLYVPFWKTIKMGVYHSLRPSYGIFVASFVTAICESLFIQPFEKTRILVIENAERGENFLIGGNNGSSQQPQSSSSSSVLEIWKKQKWKLFEIRSVFVLFCRQVIFNIFNFSTFETLGILFIVLEIELPIYLDKPIRGFCGGCLGSVMNIPLDVILARTQQQEGNEMSLLQFIRKGGLFNGLFAKILRIGPGYAIVFTMYSIITKLG